MSAKRRLLLPGFLLFVLSRSLGQPVPNPTDTNYVMTLLRRAEAIELQQPQTALRDYRKAYAVSRQIGYTKGYFESMRLLAYLLDLLGRHGESYALATEALQTALRDTSRQYRSMCYFALAQSARSQGKHKEAIGHFRQAAPYMLAHPNRKKAAVLYQNLGLIYDLEKLYPQALTYYERALKYDQIAHSTKQDLAMDYHSMAAVYVKQHQLKRGLDYYRKAAALFDPTRDLTFLINVYGNIANVHKELARYDSSLYYYRKARRLARPLNNPLQELHLLAGEAETYNVLKQYRRARARLNQAYALAKQYHVGLTEFRNIYREQANASLGLRDYRGAIPWYDKYLQTKDSLSTLEAKALLADYEVKLRQAEARQQLAEKQRRISQLEQARQRQTTEMLGAGLVGFVVVGGLVFATLYARQRRRASDSALLAAERAHALAVVQSELQGQQNERLRIAKEMHDDLGASLTAIGLLSEVAKTRMGTATTPEIEKISAISAEMVATMNEIIWSLNTRNDSLNGLIAYTRAYATEFMDAANLPLRTQVSESPRELLIRGEDRRNVFLTVKEALNNVVKHARATEVRLTIQPEADCLRIEVGDNGRGFEPDEQTRLRNGLTNMQHRMTAVGGRCDITASPAGTVVTITYPYPTEATAKIRQT